MTIRSHRIAVPLLALLVAGTGVHAIAKLASGGDGVVDPATEWLYYAVLSASAAACLLRAVIVRADRLAWVLIGLGTLSWAAGDITWELIYSNDAKPPYPSLSDFLYLLSYPFLGAGVFALAQGATRRLRGPVALDAAMAGLGAAALGAAALGPALGSYASSDPAAAFVDAAYPIGDMVIVGAAAAGAVALGWRRDFVFVGLGLVAMAVADTAYLYAEATTGYVEGTIVDSGWMLAAAFIGLAAWQPQARFTHRIPSESSAIALPSLIALVAIGLLVVDHFNRLPAASVVLAAATLVLAVIGLAVAYRDNAGLLRKARSDSLTDALTGLSNRRRLIDDLAAVAGRAERGDAEFVFAIFDLDGFKGYNDTFGHAAGDLLLRRLGSALDAAVAEHGRAYRLGGDEFCVLAPLGGAKADSIVAAASAALREDGEGFSITSSHGRAMVPAESPGPTEALQLADRRLYAEKGRSPRSFELQARDLLLGVLREREPDLRAHMEGVGALAVELGRMLGLEAEEIDVIGRAADLHDIGKMAIPDEILAKAGPLSGEEWDLMRKHTLIGERMLSASPALAPVARLVRSSHERWDGAGYPDGLRATEIPIGARIIAICDAFGAMTEERPYRERVPADEALAELRRNAGSQFDPRLVELFAEIATASPAPVTTAP